MIASAELNVYTRLYGCLCRSKHVLELAARKTNKQYLIYRIQMETLPVIFYDS
jgi:hypothetical protein